MSSCKKKYMLSWTAQKFKCSIQFAAVSTHTHTKQTKQKKLLGLPINGLASCV